MLNPTILRDALCRLNDRPDIDQFASQINAQLPQYVSYRPDPFASFVNAFTLNWDEFFPYIFPPFSLIPRVLQKIFSDQLQAVIVVPYWPTQIWFTRLQKMLVQDPILVQPRADNLILPNKPKEVHPLGKTLKLLIGVVSPHGKPSVLVPLMGGIIS